ncbi:MAG: endonuclease MutS2 [Candidatus Rifleibacteriota bacterium]
MSNSCKQFQPALSWLYKNVPVCSHFGKKALKQLIAKDNPKFAELDQALHHLSEFLKKTKKKPKIINTFFLLFDKLRDIGGTFSNLRQNKVLDETELFEIKSFAIFSDQILQLYSEFDFEFDGYKPHSLHDLIRLLNPDQLITSSFYLHESYSDELKQIRDRKRAIENRILKADNQKIKEQLRLERSEIVAAEKQEEYKVRKKLSNEISKWIDKLEDNADILGKLELMLAKTQMAGTGKTCRPQISELNDDPVFIVDQAVNPELEEILTSQGKSFTPVSIEINRGVTILTGANMGGKTVALSTIAMNAQLAKLGFFPYAKNFSMPLFDFISFVGGDEQNQRAGLSSFGAEMLHFNKIAQLTKTGSGLVIFDEFARSTNPYEGKRFVQALCEFIKKENAYGVVATHYDGIQIDKAFYYQVIGLKKVENDCTIEEPGKIDRVIDHLCENMDYRLKKVDANYQVPKDAFHIARLMQADPEFIEILKKMYD